MLSRSYDAVSLLVKALLQTTVSFLAIGAILFASAGTFVWPAAWSYLALTFGGSVAVVIALARDDPALLAERTSSPLQRDQERWDRAFFAVLAVLLPAFLIILGLDARRYRWSHVPLAVQILGAAGVAISYALTYAAFRENSFAAPVVKFQSERGQRVATGGLYRYVRHPMYAAGALFFIATSLMLGSWYGLILGAFLGASMAVRSVFEERMLLEKLEGYSEYSARVRYRLFPGVW